VDRVSYSADGTRLVIRTASGRVFESADFETWRPAVDGVTAPVRRVAASARLPEKDAQVISRTGGTPRMYAFGRFVYRSDDGGLSWENVTAFRDFSIVGEELRDLAVSPRNEDELVVAGASGVFRSLDGGKSWSGLNQGLPNLPAMRLLRLPSGDQGAQLALQDGSVIEWDPGQKQAWRTTDNSDPAVEFRQRLSLSLELGTPVTAMAQAGDFVYAGTSNGGLSVSSDGGVSWRNFVAFGPNGAVERFWVDPADPRFALAVLGMRPSNPASPSPAVHLARTENGGGFWDDLTANLPDAAVHGIAADRATGAVYAATDRGVFQTYADLASLGRAQPWTELPGLPGAAAMDVKLDAQGHQLWAALEGYGVYSTLAPHRLRDPRVVSSGDWIARAAAPGGLVSVLGARVQAARAGDLSIPVLAASDGESQLQIPFEMRGSSVSLAVDAANGRIVLPAVPLEPAAPSILVADRDGSPMLLDAESGVMLDAMTPARSRAHIQILASGLGRVQPDWPTGLAGPIDNPPRVAGNVTAYLDRVSVDVTRAVLAPYIGFYLVEVEVPKIVNSGPAELYIQVDGRASNRVRVYIEP
jgi:uncharacterized protein (TIGR03437 family)